MKKFYTLFLAIGLFFSACSESGFTGGNRGEDNGSNDVGDVDNTDQQVDNGDNGVVDPEPCVDGDRINLNYPPEIEQCVNQSRIFDFGTNTCIDTNPASFECNFDNLANTVANIGVPNSTVKTAQSDGALLISCAEKNDGKTIIAQWIYQGSYDECDFNDSTATRIVTACYKLYIEGETPPTDTPEQKNAAVQSCLKE